MPQAAPSKLCSLAELARRTSFRFDASGAKPAAPISARERAAVDTLDPRGEFAAGLRA